MWRGGMGVCRLSSKGDAVKPGDLLATKSGIEALWLAPDPVFHKFFDTYETALREGEICLVLDVAETLPPKHTAYRVVLSNGVIGWLCGAYVRQVKT